MDARDDDNSDSETRGREKFAKERTESDEIERRPVGGPGRRSVSRSRSRDRDARRRRSPIRDHRDPFHERDRFRRRDIDERGRFGPGGRGAWDRGRREFMGNRDHMGRRGRYDDRHDRDNGRDGRRLGPDMDRQEPASAVARMGPLESYKQFMMRQEDSATPEIYQKRYEEYKKRYMLRLAEAFFADHKDEEWLRQRYSPVIRYRYEENQSQKAATEAYSLKEKILAGRLRPNLDDDPQDADAGKSLAAPPAEETPASNKANEDTKTNFSLSDQAILLYIKRIPCSCPESALRAAISEAGDYHDVFLSDPSKKAHHDFERSGWIFYNNKAEADEAAKVLFNYFVKDVPVPFRMQVYQHRGRAPINTPSFMSLPARVAVDLKQAIEVADVLDKYRFGEDQEIEIPKVGPINVYATCSLNALLQEPYVQESFVDDKAKLDLVITYLRLVHYFVYYSGTKCLDMGDLLHTQPAVFRRKAFTSKDQEEDESRRKAYEEADEAQRPSRWQPWAVTLDEKMAKIIAQFDPAKRAQDLAVRQKLIKEIEEKEKESEKRLFKQKVIIDNEGDPSDDKRRCGICQKLFKAATYVEKHILNKHADVIAQEHAKAAEHYMWESFRDDEHRPMPEVHTGEAPPVVGGPSSGSGGPSMHVTNTPPGGPLLPLPGPPPPALAMPPMFPGGHGPPPAMIPPPFAPGGPRPPGFFGGRGRGRGGRGRGLPPFRSAPMRAENLPIDPRAGRVTSYVDVDAMQDKKVELDFSGVAALPPPKKKARVSDSGLDKASAPVAEENNSAKELDNSATLEDASAE